jgi:hypothetical protein
LKLNGTHILLVYDNDVNILKESVHTIQENSEALLVASTVFGLEVNANETNYMVMYREESAGRNHCMKIDKSSIERVEEFRYLVTILTTQNSIQEEIKSR